MFTNLAIPMGYHPALPETRRSWSETRVDVSTICPTKGWHTFCGPGRPSGCGAETPWDTHIFGDPSDSKVFFCLDWWLYIKVNTIPFNAFNGEIGIESPNHAEEWVRLGPEGNISPRHCGFFAHLTLLCCPTHPRMPSFFICGSIAVHRFVEKVGNPMINSLSLYIYISYT